jgi:hypothetical protein
MYYRVIKQIGTFADENNFKKKIMKIFSKKKEIIKRVFAIENREEPGMPDLLLIDVAHKAFFLEIKYAKKGVITFEWTQIPWYLRNRELFIGIVAYNDLTKNVHFIDAPLVTANAKNLSFKLADEKDFEIEDKII